MAKLRIVRQGEKTSKLTSRAKAQAYKRILIFSVILNLLLMIMYVSKS